jgi:hypothetical protein
VFENYKTTDMQVFVSDAYHSGFGMCIRHLSSSIYNETVYAEAIAYLPSAVSGCTSFTWTYLKKFNGARLVLLM